MTSEGSSGVRSRPIIVGFWILFCRNGKTLEALNAELTFCKDRCYCVWKTSIVLSTLWSTLRHLICTYNSNVRSNFIDVPIFIRRSMLKWFFCNMTCYHVMGCLSKMQFEGIFSSKGVFSFSLWNSLFCFQKLLWHWNLEPFCSAFYFLHLITPYRTIVYLLEIGSGDILI